MPRSSKPKQQEIVTFRVTKEVADQLRSIAPDLVMMPGAPTPSKNSVARALMFFGLETWLKKEE